MAMPHESAGSVPEAVEYGRASFARRAWRDACRHLQAANAEAPLPPEDLERLATAAYLVGRDADSFDIWARAYHTLMDRGDVTRAARCAFWLGFELANNGEMVVAKLAGCDACTGVVALPSATRDGRLIHAQNWDWKAECAETAVVLKIHRDDGPDILTFTEAGGTICPK